MAHDQHISARDQKRSRHFDLDGARRALKGGDPYVYWGLDITPARVNGQQLLFATDKIRDPIQRHHRKGEFYEIEELERIGTFFPEGGVFVDIGANVGNHSLFVAAFLKPSRVIPFEPNPLAYRLLMANIAFNGLGDVFVLDHIGYGVSDVAAGGFAMAERSRNLGAARMIPGEGDIEVKRGDDALADVTPDLIKIDVEGMEISVLNGITETVGRARPRIMIEVDNANEEAFHDWVDRVGYKVTDTNQRYRANKNYFLQAADSEA